MQDPPSRPDALPDFADPPIVEVVMGVQFPPLQMRQAHVGAIWSTFQQQYPLVEDHDLLTPMPTPGSTVLPTLHLHIGPQLDRSWFFNQDRGRLIQLQSDRFVHNWRKVDDPYPRYEHLRGQFVEVWERFTARVAALDLGPVLPEVAELTYVNNLPAGPAGPTFLRAHGAMHATSAYLDPHPLDGMVRSRFALTPAAEFHAAELHVSVEPTFAGGQLEGYRYVLSCRAALKDSATDTLLAFYDRGREVIVQTFADLIDEEMLMTWGLRQP